MSDIYERKLWGGSKHDFYSGAGSHSKRLVKPYIKAISDFLKTFDQPLTVCDLGCGDFNVGRHLVPFAKKYIGVDVVEPLVERNKRKFTQKNLEFLCLNMVEDELPKADCVLIRQVFQHLSNDAITKVIKKFGQYNYIIVTEHLPKNDFIANLDKPTEANIRLSKSSGVVLTEAPFNFRPTDSKVLLDLRYSKGRVVTTVYHY